MAKIIDGKKIAERVKDAIAKEIFELQGPRPNLAIILVGERSDSELYVSLKEKEAKKVGIDTCLYRMADNVPEEELLETIEFLNRDQNLEGILLQLPLPEHFDTDKIIKAIDPLKDVDGFHPEHPEYIVSPVLASVKACLNEIKFESEGKRACLLYNSEIFGGELKKLMKDLGVEVSSKKEMKNADLIITALGDPKSIKGEQIKQDAVIIDVGITKTDEGVFGDVDFESVKDKVSYITPVPGGIGPMTIAFLFDNVLKIYKRR